MNYEIKKLNIIDENIVKQIVDVWEKAIRATHHFLEEDKIIFYKKYIPSSICEEGDLIGVFNQNDNLIAFMFIQNKKIEMLFIDSDYFRQGIGKSLIEYAIFNYNVERVDCNEQNPQAVQFYKTMGFETFKRSSKDAEGNDFPILHMNYNKTP